MSFASACESWQDAEKEKVIQATWGHLAPKKGKKYPGSIVFAVGCFGNDDLNPTPLSCKFKELESSPWFYESLTEFLSSLTSDWKDGQAIEKVAIAGNVYRFEGYFKNYQFIGDIEQLTLC